VEIVAALLLAFGLAAYLRIRRWPALRAIALASLLAPLAVTFSAYVFPADPEFRMWWRVTVLTSVFFGLCAAAAGYLLIGLVRRQRT
jgi:predicted membrane protein